MATLEEVLKKAADWPGIEKLGSVQDILDKNKVLINEIHHNHELRTPDALQRNVLLIRELNANIGKVVQCYQEMSVHVDMTADQPAASMQTTAS